MIKLIACDMDGTLIKDYTRPINASVFELVKKFKKKGVLFAPTSGRQLPNLKKLFEPIKNEVTFIGENGAIILHNNKIIHKSVLDSITAKKLATKILEIPSLEVQICCENTTYIMPKTEEFLKMNQSILKNNFTIVNSLEEINDDILKIAMYEPVQITPELVKPLVQEFGGKFHHVLSGLRSYDFMNYGIHKGNAVKILQKALNISNEEVVAFGDNFNDIEMLENAEYSYAMEDAAPDVKKYAKYISSCVETSLNELYNKFFG